MRKRVCPALTSHPCSFGRVQCGQRSRASVREQARLPSSLRQVRRARISPWNFDALHFRGGVVSARGCKGVLRVRGLATWRRQNTAKQKMMRRVSRHAPSWPMAGRGTPGLAPCVCAARHRLRQAPTPARGTCSRGGLEAQARALLQTMTSRDGAARVLLKQGYHRLRGSVGVRVDCNIERCLVLSHAGRPPERRASSLESSRPLRGGTSSGIVAHIASLVVKGCGGPNVVCRSAPGGLMLSAVGFMYCRSTAEESP